MTLLDTTTDTGHPTGRRRDPLLGWAALGGVAVTLAVLLIPHETLDADAPSAAQVTDFFTSNYTIQQSQPLMHSIGGVLLLLFLLRLATLLREVGRPWASEVVRAAGIVITAVVITTMAWVAAVVRLTGDIEGTLQWALYSIGWDFHFRLLYLLPLVLIPTGWVLRKAGAAALGWFSLVLGGLTAVAPLAYLGRETWVVQYPAFLLFLLWAVVAGITLGLRGVRR